MSAQFYVYILASHKHGTLYVGGYEQCHSTSLSTQAQAVRGFTKRYNVDKLEYFEIFDDPLSAIGREKKLKKWNRDWKIGLIEGSNPGWIDLSRTLI